MKVTYLLGAGASANALPVYNCINTELKNVINKLDILCNSRFKIENNFLTIFNFDKINQIGFEKIMNYYNLLAEKNSNEIVEFIKWLKCEFRTLYKNRGTFSTIDNYAKFLFETKKMEEFEKLKFISMCFIVLFQDHFYLFNNADRFKSEEGKKYYNEYFIENGYTKIDYRYFNFISSLHKNGKYSDDVLILNWNYDSQIEMVMSNYDKEQINYHIPQYQKAASSDVIKESNFISIPSSSTNNLKKGKTHLVHLNSLAGAFSSLQKTINYFNNQTEENNLAYNYLLKMKNLFAHKEVNVFNIMKYAWELENFENHIDYQYEDKETTQLLKDNIKQHLNETTHFICIGYSFPFYNKEIDLQIIKELDATILKEIILQNPDNQSNLFEERFSNEIKNSDRTINTRIDGQPGRHKSIDTKKIIEYIKIKSLISTGEFYIPYGF